MLQTERLRKYDRKYYAKMRKCLIELKINGCAICGFDECNRALSFHHTNPKDKKFQINASSIRRMSEEDFIEELNKCILLCCNCHMMIEEKEKHRGK